MLKLSVVMFVCDCLMERARKYAQYRTAVLIMQKNYNVSTEQFKGIYFANEFVSLHKFYTNIHIWKFFVIVFKYKV